jgi:hypothetical protein
MAHDLSLTRRVFQGSSRALRVPCICMSICLEQRLVGLHYGRILMIIPYFLGISLVSACWVKLPRHLPFLFVRVTQIPAWQEAGSFYLPDDCYTKTVLSYSWFSTAFSQLSSIVLLDTSLPQCGSSLNSRPHHQCYHIYCSSYQQYRRFHPPVPRCRS